MKFLGWMHNKFQHKTNEPFKIKDFTKGQTFQDEQQHLPMSSYDSKPMIKPQKDNNFKNQKSVECPHHNHHQDTDKNDDDEELSGIFHGFLAIGTLGTNPAVYDPSTTPTFYISVDNIMEKETQVTEEDVKLINGELEKVLSYDESCNLSTGRNSHVSTGRSSHCSTITVSSKPRESTENTISCPLQSYLLGSVMGYQETITTINSSPQKENRVSVSLGELFQKKYEEKKCGVNEKKAEKKTDKSAAFILKKMMKWKKNYGLSTSANEASGGTRDGYVSSEKKLVKILQIFQRKIHPETSATTKKKPIKTKDGLKDEIKAGGKFGPSNTAQIELNGIGPKEHWIKSDSDYLVLEL